MSLNVEVEIIVADHWIAGERVVEGQKIAVAPTTAVKLVGRGIAKKVGVVEAEAEEEIEAAEPETEEAAEDDDTVGSDA